MTVIMCYSFNQLYNKRYFPQAVRWSYESSFSPKGITIFAFSPISDPGRWMVLRNTLTHDLWPTPISSQKSSLGQLYLLGQMTILPRVPGSL